MNPENANPFAVATRPGTIEHLLASPNIRQRFNQMLGERAPQFVSSIITVYKGFTQQVEPSSVIASAAIAATLDLPIERHLGFAHIVPYAGQAQFQMGYRGYIQLALRSGQYQNLNAKAINAAAFKGYDNIGEPIIDWSKLDETQPPVGYAFAWRLTTGFFKTVYWPKEKVEDHASRYSQAFKKKKMDSPWFTAFDAMALKTVITDGLRKWGILSVQMQGALKFDQAVLKDIDADPVYVEGSSNILPPKPPAIGGDDQAEVDAGLQPARRGRPRKQQGGTVPTESHQPGVASSTLAPATTSGGAQPGDTTAGISAFPPQQVAQPARPPVLQPIDPKDPNQTHIVIMQLTRGMLDANLTEEQLMDFCKDHDLATAQQTSLGQLATKKLVGLCEKWPEVVNEIRGA